MVIMVSTSLYYWLCVSPSLSLSLSSLDMKSFIPEEDRAFFEAFLIENNLPVDQSGSSAETVPARQERGEKGGGGGGGEGGGGGGGGGEGGGGGGERGRGGAGGGGAEGGGRGRKRRSHTAHVADVDKFLADIDSHTQSMLNSTNT